MVFLLQISENTDFFLFFSFIGYLISFQPQQAAVEPIDGIEALPPDCQVLAGTPQRVYFGSG